MNYLVLNFNGIMELSVIYHKIMNIKLLFLTLNFWKIKSYNLKITKLEVSIN